MCTTTPSRLIAIAGRRPATATTPCTPLTDVNGRAYANSANIERSDHCARLDTMHAATTARSQILATEQQV